MIEYVMRIIQNVFNNVNTAAETPLGETVVSIIVIIVVGIIVCIIASGIGMIVASIFKGIRINLAGMLAAVIAEFVLLGSVPEKGLIEYLIGGLIILAGLVGCGMTLIIGKEYGWGKCSKKQTGGYAYYYAACLRYLRRGTECFRGTSINGVYMCRSYWQEWLPVVSFSARSARRNSNDVL